MWGQVEHANIEVPLKLADDRARRLEKGKDAEQPRRAQVIEAPAWSSPVAPQKRT